MERELFGNQLPPFTLMIVVIYHGLIWCMCGIFSVQTIRTQSLSCLSDPTHEFYHALENISSIHTIVYCDINGHT